MTALKGDDSSSVIALTNSLIVVVITIAGMGFSMGYSISGLTSGYFRSIEWDTIGSNNWQMLSSSVVMSSYNWGNNTPGFNNSWSNNRGDWSNDWGYWSNDSVNERITGLGLSVGNSVGSLSSSYFRGVVWDTVRTDDWQMLGSNPLVVSGVGNWGNWSNNWGSMSYNWGSYGIIAGLGFNESSSMASLGSNNFRGVIWDTIGSDDWEMLWVSGMVGVDNWSGVEEITLVQMVDKWVSVAYFSFNVGVSVSNLSVSYFRGVQGNAMSADDWNVVGSVCGGSPWSGISGGSPWSGVGSGISGTYPWSGVRSGNNWSYWSNNWSNWGDFSVDVSIAGLGFDVSASMGSLSSGYFGGVVWDTIGPDGWDVLWSNPLVVTGVSDWGSYVSDGSGGYDWSSDWGYYWGSVGYYWGSVGYYWSGMGYYWGSDVGDGPSGYYWSSNWGYDWSGDGVVSYFVDFVSVVVEDGGFGGYYWGSSYYWSVVVTMVTDFIDFVTVLVEHRGLGAVDCWV